MRIVFAAIPAYGHLYPVLPLAMACAAAGHDVRIAAGGPFLDRLPLPTIPGIPAGAQLDGIVEETRRRHPQAHGHELSVAMFADTTAKLVSATLDGVLGDLNPDLVVFEAMNIGAAMAADVHDVPAVGFAIGLAPFVVDMIHTAARGFRADFWSAHGREVPSGSGLLCAALLDPSPPSLTFTDGKPATVPRWPIRSVAYAEGQSPVPDWLTGNRSRPAVYLTLGTVSFGAVEVIGRAIDQIAALDVDLLVAVGPEGDPAALGEVPDHVHIERFVPQSQVLNLVDLIVHHGGTGTVLGAAAAGLPQLILPQGADQFINADLIAQCGVGRSVRNDAQEDGAIGEAVRAMLGDCPERRRAREVRGEIAAMPGPDEVVTALERLVAGG